MSRVLIAGVRYEVRFAGAGTPLLLLHGFTGRGASWAAHLPSFGRSATTVVVDLLGHGRSDAPRDPARHAVERQAADLAVLLDRLAEPADVLGYSFGARIALRLAIDHPTVVRRLVLESPSAGIADPVEREARRRADEALALDIEAHGIEAFVDRWEAQPLFASLDRLPASRRRRAHAARLRNRPAGLAASLRGAGQGSMLPLISLLPTLDVPVLVVTGEGDPAGPRAREVAAQIPRARLEIVRGVGHAPHLEAPARFRDIVRQFLADAGDGVAFAPQRESRSPSAVRPVPPATRSPAPPQHP